MIIIIFTDNQGLYAEIRSLYSFRKQIFNPYALQLPEGKQLSNAPWQRNCSQHYDGAPSGQSCLDKKAIASIAKVWQRFGGKLWTCINHSGWWEKTLKGKKPESSSIHFPLSRKVLAVYLFGFMFGIVLFYLSGGKGKFLQKENKILINPC